MNGISFNSKHSSKDFGLTIKSKEINPPQKIKIKETVPFMQGSYDFSLIYGEQTYDERSLIYTFNLVGENKIDLNTNKIKIVNWLSNPTKIKLIDDDIPGFYFNAECENIDFKEDGRFAEIVVEFKAEPFMISEVYNGNENWDDFNFELDYMQETKFTVIDKKKVKIFNNGSRKISPLIKSTSSLIINKNGINYNFNEGTMNNNSFTLDVGENEIELIGNTTVEFLFRKEVL